MSESDDYYKAIAWHRAEIRRGRSTKQIQTMLKQDARNPTGPDPEDLKKRHEIALAYEKGRPHEEIEAQVEKVFGPRTKLSGFTMRSKSRFGQVSRSPAATCEEKTMTKSSRIDAMMYRDAKKAGKTDPFYRLHARAYELHRSGKTAQANRLRAIATSLLDGQERRMRAALVRQICATYKTQAKVNQCRRALKK